MSESKEICTMRAMAWHRAKGELNSILSTYYNNDNYGKMEEAITDFVSLIEDNGIQE
jgi:hypothetical protein